MLKKSKKFITSMLSSCLIMGIIPISNITVNAEGKSYKVNLNKINPVVQDLKEIGEGFTLTDTVELVGSNTADAQAVRFLKDLLETNNIKVNLVNKEEDVDYNNTVIILGEATGDNADAVIESTIAELPEMNSEVAFNNDEGYTLYTSNDIEGKEAGVIVIAGKDGDGTYYGTRTLEKIIKVEENLGVPEVDVEDYPEIKFRGIVEGFYGDPWTHENRLGLLEMSGDNKMNTYIYGPKDDPYHRGKWREPYPEGEAEKIAQLATKATENKVDFVWAVHPGGDINFNDQDYNTLLTKFEQMYELGVRGFAVFFDDIGGNSPQAQAENQAWLLNKLNEDFIKVKGDVAPLTLCPTEYNKAWANKTPGTYLDILGDQLDPSIQVMWTGNDVMSDMDYDTLDWVNQRINREAYVWWNFPVNDYCRDKLLLGSSYGLNPNMSNAGGFTSNPMNQAEASKFALFSVANYTWNTDAYNAEQSWHNAIEDLVPEVAEDFKIFSTHNTDPGPRYRRKESEHIASTLDDFKNKLANNEAVGTDGDRLIQEFQAIKGAGRNILDNCSNKELVKEAEQWLQSFEQLGIAGESTVNAIIALQQGDYDGWWNNYVSAKKALDEMARIDKHNREVLKKSGITVASQKLTPFVKSMFKEVEGLYINEVYKDDNSVYKVNPYTSLKDKASINNMLDGDEGTYWYSQALQEVGDYYGVDLGKVIPITDIIIVQGRNDNDHDRFHKGILEYSVDGENWTPIGEERTGIRIGEENLNIEARYVRYRATYAGIPGGKPDLWTAVREFTVNKNYGDKVLSNIEALKNIDLNIDNQTGSIAYPEVTDLEIAPENYFGVELNKLASIDEIKLAFSGELTGLKIQYSINGIEWSDLETTASNGELTVIDNIVAKYVRVLNSSEEAANGNLTKFEIMRTVEANPVASTNAKIYDGNVENLTDGNFSTYLWTEEQKVGDYYEVDLGAPIDLHDINIYSHTGDYIRSGLIEVSANGETWTTIKDFSLTPQVQEARVDPNIDTKSDFNIITGDAKGNKYRYIRVKMTAPSNMWTKVFEITFNETVKKEDVSSIESTIPGEVNKIADGRMDTAFEGERDAKAGDSILYKLTSVKDLKNIHILQDDGAISNGKVSVRSIDNEWVEVGTLDKAFNNINLQSIVDLGKSNKILDIKISWEGNAPAPKIYEINTLAGELTKPPVEESNGKVMLTIPDKVKVGETLKVGLGLIKIKEDISAYAADYTINYDPNIFEFKEAKASIDGIYVTSKEISEGQIRILAASLGGEGLPKDLNFINILLEPKVKSEDSLISVTNVTIGDGHGETIEIEGAEKNVVVEEAQNPPVTGVKPNKPSNLVVSESTDSTITLSWDAPDNIPVKEYIIYKDGVQIDTIPAVETTYTAEGLKANTLYGFKIVAISNDDLKSRPVAINGRTKKASKVGFVDMIKSIIG
ncbi:MAG: beta-N-acetylglucosaminidase domain-containing protein [Sarcina sp.]